MRKIILIIIMVFISIGCKKNLDEEFSGYSNNITIVSLNPAQGDIISSSTTISSTLSYKINEREVSTYGFQISIQFLNTDGNTFSISTNYEDRVIINNREGSVTINYPMNLIWSYAELVHPVKCQFNLIKNISETSGIVLASTEVINFIE